MGVSIREVAERAGVSRGTVSQVLNGNMAARITPETRERIRRVAEEMGYQPNYHARSLGRRRTDTIGLMISGLQNPFFVDVMESAERLAQQAGYQVLLDAGLSAGGTYGEHAKLRNWPVDGILMWAYARQRLDDFIGVRARDVPVVYLGYLRDDGADAVGFDLYGGGRQAAEHLVSRGYHHLAFVTPYRAEPDQPLDDRHRACVEVCREAGVILDTLLLESPEETRAVGFRAGLSLAAQHRATRPQALFCHNDVIAVGLYHGLRRGGLRVPDDIAVMGFDGTDEGRYLDVPLSTIATPGQALCERAIEILLRRMSGDKDSPPQQIAVPTELVVGGTA